MNDSYDAFEGLPPGSELMVAFSGGVDSSVAVLLCRQAGFRVRGVCLSLLGRERLDEKRLRDAAEKLEMPLDILELSGEFENTVIRYAWEEYSHARTPNPCARCNPLFKFGRLSSFAGEKGCAALVTGHYARVIRSSAGPRLLKGTFQPKDQSYFLFGLSREQLSFACFPLGGMSKPEVRDIARKAGLACADSGESQDICFAPPDSSKFGEMLRIRFHAEAVCGNFITPEGRILGKHCGIHNYTVGQRKGTNVAMGVPAYVKSIDEKSRNIILTTENDSLFVPKAVLKNPNWILPAYGELPEFECEVKIRYRSRGVKTTVRRLAADTLELEFAEPQRAVTPGQAAVFYHGDELLGGAWIE